MNPAIGAALISSAAGFLGAQQQNQAAKASAARQMAFQKEMSNTSYQRAMDDMRAAGLNPILAYKQGGASTPSGAMYQPVNPGLAGAQGAQAMASAQGMQQENRIRQINLDYLEKNGLNEYTIKYTVKNVLGSKVLKTVEDLFNGREIKEEPYRSVAVQLQKFLLDHGVVSRDPADERRLVVNNKWQDPEIAARLVAELFLIKKSLQLSGVKQ